MRFWIIYFLVQISFLGKGVLASVILTSFVVGQPWLPTFLLNPFPLFTLIKLSTTLSYDGEKSYTKPHILNPNLYSPTHLLVTLNYIVLAPKKIHVLLK